LLEDIEPVPGHIAEHTLTSLPDPAASLHARNRSIISVPVEENPQEMDDAPDPRNSTDDGDHGFMELMPLLAGQHLPQGYDGTRDIGNFPSIAPASDEAVPFGTWTSPHAFIQPHMGHAAQAPWAAWTTSITSHSASPTRNLVEVFSLPRTTCLALLEPTSSVVRHSRHLVVQALRAYPLMMLRRETLPPFIHGYWNTPIIPALPQTLSNCMSIAQMYAFRTDETKPFLWRTIRAEGERFLSEVTLVHSLTSRQHSANASSCSGWTQRRRTCWRLSRRR
jgi:hypothetical protein